MEPVLLLLLSLLLLSSQAASQSQDAVLDLDGNALRRGAQYHVLPASDTVRGRGLRMSRVNGSCPPHVIQSILTVHNGQPLMFFPEVPRADSVVRVAERIYVMFPRPTRCPQSTLWNLNDKLYVTTGGTRSLLADPHFSRFSILKSRGRGYVIQSCPCRRCSMPCSNVVVNVVNGRRLLSVSLSEAAYEVVFVRVKEESTNDDILPATMLPLEEE